MKLRMEPVAPLTGLSRAAARAITALSVSRGRGLPPATRPHWGLTPGGSFAGAVPKGMTNRQASRIGPHREVGMRVKRPTWTGSV